MAQPNNFGFGEEAALLKDSARKFFEEKMPTNQLHALVAGDPTPERMPESLWDKDIWQQMVDLGWTMVAVPEAAGGIGMPVVAVAGLVEELGRAAFPCPLVPTINCTYVLSACGSAGESALGDIAEGKSASLAITNQQGSWSTTDTDVRFENGKLSGTAWYVQDARKVDNFLVSAQSTTGVSLYWVSCDASGVVIDPDAIIDLSRDQAHVTFTGVEAVELAADGSGALDKAFPAIWTVLAADIVGAAEWLLQTTVDYVSTRKQFEHPLGFFQAVKHPLVDVMVQIDQTKSLVYNAACAIDSEPEKALKYAHMAKASASETAAFSSGRAVQYHGGIGFTWECYVHLYFKRQKHNQMLWGDAAWHRRALAGLLLGPIAA
ncbi:MAG: acyl-CoA/acyl-ACP dehydrogenase [Proteobacteria bacterium]|nr:acyl-CoA/acyl-ACP dehydrogenase [Pseudomonadota bacterium]